MNLTVERVAILVLFFLMFQHSIMIEKSITKKSINEEEKSIKKEVNKKEVNKKGRFRKKSKKPDSCYPKVGLRPFKDRTVLPELLNEYNLTTGIEVGVKEGAFSKQMLDRWKSCEKYHLVDLWAKQENYADLANVENHVHDQFYANARKNLNAHLEKVEFYRMLSTEAASKFEEESIDFIYIDARHDYCGVKEDLEHYWPILKPGGIMAGHDYNTNIEIGSNQDWGLCRDGTRNEMAVKGAVNDFFVPKGLTITVSYWQQPMFMSWAVQKPMC